MGAGRLEPAHRVVGGSPAGAAGRPVLSRPGVRPGLKTPEGKDLGWKELRSNSVSVACFGSDAQFVEAVLKNAPLRRESG